MNPYLKMRLLCMNQERRALNNIIESLFSKVGECCPSSSSQPPSSSSSIPSSSSSFVCPEYDTIFLYDEWVWNRNTNNGSGQGVNIWIGTKRGKVLTTYPAREDSKRAKVQDGCILINGSPTDKRAYHALFPNDWYQSGDGTAYSNCIFAVVEINLLKPGEATLWNHMITGETNFSFNSFSTQASTGTIGTRTNSSIYTNIPAPSIIANQVKRYLVEMRYGDQDSVTQNDFLVYVNGMPIVQASSPYACRNVFGVGVVAPQDLAANSTLDRRLLSVLTLKNKTSPSSRIPIQEINAARNYLSCIWDIPLT